MSVMPFLRAALHLAVLPGLACCAAAQTPPVSGPLAAASAPPPAASAASAARAEAAAPRPFAEVIKEARRSDGYLPVWRHDEKVWLEIPAELLGKPLLLTMNVANSLGERGLYASQMGDSAIAEFRQVGRSVQLVLRNTDYRADGDTAIARAVRQSFSDSLLAAAPLASAPHPERKSLLVDAAFLQADLIGYSTALEQAYRLPYSVDKVNSTFDPAHVSERATSLTVQLHFATPRLPAPPLMPPPPGTPRTPLPSTMPDPRSFFVGVVYNFAALPATPMPARLADPRIGHFTAAYTDLSSDLKPRNRVHHVLRWRLEKKDPAAALSEPVRPVTYWLDRNIPERYRAAVTAGVLEWNKAFERIGLKNALVVRQQPDDADFDTLDPEHVSIRWFAGADVSFARGPSAADPRTGEILEAHIAMSDAFSRVTRRLVSEDLALGTPDAYAPPGPGWRAPQEGAFALCHAADGAARELGFALDLLEARGDLAPDSPEAEALVQAVVKDTIVHEVGHTLGLKHNFRASTTVTQAQLRDKAYTDAHGLSGSVMDYNNFNLPLAGEPAAALAQTTLGPYDYWAIEYAYKPLEPAVEATGLAAIAARSSEPALAFADDADADDAIGVDPRDNRFDLGDDPLAWAQRRLLLSKELWARVQQRGPRPGDDPQRLRRSVIAGLRQLQLLPALAAKHIGGMYAERDLPGTTSRPVYRPVEPDRQRQALKFLAEGVFSADSFRFRPEFLAALAPDYIEWERSGPLSVPAAVLALQNQALDRLFAPGTARRLLELPYYLPAKEQRGAISLNEVYATLQAAVWSELKTGAEIDPLRRNLQREHLKRMAALLTHVASGLPADAASLLRMQAHELQAALQRAGTRRGGSVETRAHLQESLDLLSGALRATMQRG